MPSSTQMLVKPSHDAKHSSAIIVRQIQKKLPGLTDPMPPPVLRTSPLAMDYQRGRLLASISACSTARKLLANLPSPISLELRWILRVDFIGFLLDSWCWSLKEGGSSHVPPRWATVPA